MTISDPAFKRIVVERFSGLLTTLDIEDLPPSYANPCRNAAFTSGGMDSREGTSVICDLAQAASILDAEFLLFNGTRYYFFVMNDNNLYYTTDAFAAGTLLVTTTTTCTRVQVLGYGNLVYIFLGGNAANFGLEEVRVWNPTAGTVDLITIIPEAIGSMAAASGGAGDVSVGLHKIKVVFETRTGYRSSPTTGTVEYTATADDSIDLTAIPTYTGSATHVAAECTRRHIVMTAGGLESYYIAATIENNTATTVTIDIADSQLIQQTNVDDYFQFQSPAPKLSTGIIYHERLIACGDSTNGSLAWTSELGSPQSFRGDVGFIQVDADNGQDLIKPFSIRDILYLIKTIGLYASIDNGETPDSWPMMIISHEIGTVSMKGVSEKSDENFVVIQDFRGVYYFNGSPPRKLTQMIQPTWDTVNVANFRKGEIHIDSVKRRVYNLVPTGVSTTVNEIFVCDYQEGWDNVKWSTWATAGTAWRTMCVDTGGYRVLIGGASQDVFLIDDDEISDNGTAIDYLSRQGVIQAAPAGLALFGGIDFYVQGEGSMTLKIYDLHGTLLDTPTALTLADPGTQDLFRRLNLRNERIFVEFGHNSATAWSHMRRMTVFTKTDGTRAY